jgi:hypothetical protein
MITHPHNTWVFEQRADGAFFRFDSSEVAAILDGLPISDPSVLSFLCTYLVDGLKANTMN